MFQKLCCCSSAGKTPDEISQPSNKQGNIGDKSVVEAKNQKSKKWFILAIVIGSIVVVGVGGFGAAGLLHVHNLVNLPQWAASAIGTIGHTPHFWSLWALTTGGVVGGGGFIAFGSTKIHQAKLAKKLEPENLWEKKFEQLKKERMEEVSKLPKIDKNNEELENVLSKNHPSMDIFTEDLSVVGLTPELFEPLNQGTYKCREFGREVSKKGRKTFVPSKRKDRRFIMIKTHDGLLKCTPRITVQQSERIVQLLHEFKFEEH